MTYNDKVDTWFVVAAFVGVIGNGLAGNITGVWGMILPFPFCLWYLRRQTHRLDEHNQQAAPEAGR